MMLSRVKSLKKAMSLFLTFALMFSAFIMAPGKNLAYAVSSAPILSMNYQSYVSSADVNYTGMITKPQYGMPLGTGAMGSLVWNNNTSSLNFQINRVDVFGYNSAATGVDGSSDYGYGIAYLNVNLGGSPFSSTTSQHLSLYDGKLTVAGTGVSVDIMGDTSSDVFALKISDTRSSPQPITVDLAMLQNPDVTSGTHVATTRTSDSGGQIRLQETYTQPTASGYTQDDHYCSAAVVADVSGRTGTVSYPDSKTVRLTLPAAAGTAYVYVGSHASLNSSDNVVTLAANKVTTAKSSGFDTIYSNNQTWWQNYWSKSYVNIASDSTTSDIQKKWIYYLYCQAISNRGSYPAKFAGNIWNTGGLNKMWGTQYWGWNQQTLEYSLDEANHTELNQPYFTMDMKDYNAYSTAAQQQWGSQGIFIEETGAFNGPELLTSTIANDLKNFMLNATSPTSTLSSYASAHNSMESRWELQPTYWTTFNTINSSEHAEIFWNYYLYTQDTNFLSTEAYPMLKGAAEFYRNFPNLKLESDGKYHIYRTNLHEHIMGAKDVIDDLVFIKGVMQAAIKASQILGVDATLRPQWQNIVDNLAPYPVSGASDTIGSLTDSQGLTTWGQARTPAAQVRTDALSGSDSPRERMLENYDVLTLETKDQGLDNGDWTIANRTFQDSPAYTSNMSQASYGYAGGRYLLDAAKLGRSEFMTVLNNINNAINSLIGTSANRLAFSTSDFTEYEGYGIMSAGLQDSLMQSIAPTPGGDPVIRVFPAWNISKPANFKLAAKGGFIVSSSCKNNAIGFVEINSQLGGTCRIRNPWAGSTITLYRNGVKAEDLSGSLISFSTSTGEDIKIVKQNVNPDSLDQSIPMTYQTYEAENASLTSPAEVNTNHTGYTGTGFVDGYYNSAAANTTFTVNVPTAGTYNIALRYSAGNGTSTNTGLAVNGVYLKNITCSATADWNTWATETEAVSLNAGINTISYPAKSASTSCINLDNISVS